MTFLNIVKFGEKYQEPAIVLILVVEERAPAVKTDIVAVATIILRMVTVQKMQSMLFHQQNIDVSKNTMF